MNRQDDADTPIWAGAKSRKQVDILKEVARTLSETEIERSRRPIDKLTQSDLEIEQGRLEEVLDAGKMTVEDFRRLQEIDYFLNGMRQRRDQISSYEGWRHESLTED
jgi:hypothetical protein